MELIQILKDFEGIIGAVLGSVATLVTTYCLQHRGKLKNYSIEYIARFQTFKDVGCGMKGKEDKDIYGYSIRYRFEIYNGYDYPRVVRKFLLDFYRNKKLVFSEVPKDELTRIYNHHISHAENSELANIPSHEIMAFDQSVYLMYSDESFNKLDGITRVELSYLDENDKKRTIIISEDPIIIPKVKKKNGDSI